MNVHFFSLKIVIWAMAMNSILLENKRIRNYNIIGLKQYMEIMKTAFQQENAHIFNFSRKVTITLQTFFLNANTGNIFFVAGISRTILKRTQIIPRLKATICGSLKLLSNVGFERITPSADLAPINYVKVSANSTYLRSNSNNKSVPSYFCFNRDYWDIHYKVCVNERKRKSNT